MRARYDHVMDVPVTSYTDLVHVLTEYTIVRKMRWLGDAEPIVFYSRDGGFGFAIHHDKHWSIFYHERMFDHRPLDALRKVDEHLEALERKLTVPPAHPAVEVARYAAGFPIGKSNGKGRHRAVKS